MCSYSFVIESDLHRYTFLTLHVVLKFGILKESKCRKKKIPNTFVRIGFLFFVFALLFFFLKESWTLQFFLMCHVHCTRGIPLSISL